MHDPTNQTPIADDDTETIDSTLNQRHKVGDDKTIEPDPDLVGYQDDLATGDKDDVAQYEQGDKPTDVTGMPEAVLKEELDELALDEGQTTDTAADDDRREHIEDVDENDKPRE